ncbi:DNA/RNA helicase domain-containing protein [Microbacterium sp. P04]|uniref:DNA/RNA helicase domain-containing protein n=1 Tax=Microbacterium sp. P04 TaxID=3366947 RepID=UPI003746EAB8
MTPFEIERLDFTTPAISSWASGDERRTNWPVVYVLDSAESSGAPSVYVGETVSAVSRMRQHLQNPSKAAFRRVRVVIDETFNKSACLDLESHLIRWLAGDGHFSVLNGNEGIIDARYYEREQYRESFRDIFEQMRSEGIFHRSIPEIENSDLFKLSPFKVLTREQAVAVEQIVEAFLGDLATGARSTSVLQGDPGTGKTIVAIFLMKLLADIRDYDDTDEIEQDSLFSEFFVPENRELLKSVRVGFVVPQQSLRDSIKKVFKKTPKVSESHVLNPFEVGKSSTPFDLLIVDETHRLNRRANQSSGVRNRDFTEINERLFGSDDLSKTQLDWIRAQSKHQILLFDEKQGVRPADLPAETLAAELAGARQSHRWFPLARQMRVKAEADYVGFVRQLLRGELRAGERPDFGEYDLRFFDSVVDMKEAIRERDREAGLARLVAGYAWDWKTRGNKPGFDFELEGTQFVWNRTDKDWINSRGSIDEVGSIHTVQGYDLNYAGVIIGGDLRYDEFTRQVVVDRDAYRDKKGKENLAQLRQLTTDDDLLALVQNIYGVLLTRGILGTYIHVRDPKLRDYLSGVLRTVTRGGGDTD